MRLSRLWSRTPGVQRISLTVISIRTLQRNPFHPSKPKNISKDLRSNFCRNPDNDPRGPWCFVQTRNRVRYQYCNIRSCNKRTPDMHPNAYRPLPQLENLLSTVNLNTPVRNS